MKRWRQPSVSPTLRDDDRVHHQDLEQLLFYAAISPSQPMTNYLVFHASEPRRNPRISVFKVHADDYSFIRKEMVKRAEILRRCLSDRTAPSHARCRYHGEHCQFGENSICACSSASILDTLGLFEHITLSRREAVERVIGDSIKAYVPTQEFSVWDLIFPRKWYHRVFQYELDAETETHEDPSKRAAIDLAGQNVGGEFIGFVFAVLGIVLQVFFGTATAVVLGVKLSTLAGLVGIAFALLGLYLTWEDDPVDLATGPLGQVEEVRSYVSIGYSAVSTISTL